MKCFPKSKPIPTPRMGTFAVSGGPPPENALDALLDELQTFSKPLTQNNEIRPDDSTTSDESSQAIQSTVTTQISQARLYTQNDINAQTNAAMPALTTTPMSTATLTNVNVKQLVQNTMNNITNSNNINNSNTLPMHTNVSSLRRLHSYASSSIDNSEVGTAIPNSQNNSRGSKPPVPERSADLISKIAAGKRIPPPPPPRTSSRSPLASPTSPNVPHTLATVSESNENQNKNNSANATDCSSGNSSGNESVASNEHVQRQVVLEMRHKELLKKQKMLQEQYQRLQQLSKISTVDVTTLPANMGACDNSGNLPLLKTGSESNIQQKMGLRIAAAPLDSTKIEYNLDLANKDITATERQKLVQNFKAQNMPNLRVNAPSNGTTTTMAAKEGSTRSTNNTNSTTKQLYETEII